MDLLLDVARVVSLRPVGIRESRRRVVRDVARSNQKGATAIEGHGDVVGNQPILRDSIPLLIEITLHNTEHGDVRRLGRFLDMSAKVRPVYLEKKGKG